MSMKTLNTAFNTTIRLPLVLAVIAALTLGGCGFHLRGQAPLSERLSPLALGGDDRELLAELRDAVDFNGVALALDEADASAVVELIESVYDRRVRTTDDRGRATSYTLVYEVRVGVVDSAGETLVKPFRVATRRQLAFNRTQVLQAERRERTLREDMQREISQTIMRRLSKVAAIEPLNFDALGRATAARNTGTTDVQITSPQT